MPAAKRVRFDFAEDKAMLQFLVTELKDGSEDASNPFGNKIWRTAIERGVVTDRHSVQSVRDHFRRQLWPRLNLQPIDEEGREYLKKMIRSDGGGGSGWVVLRIVLSVHDW